jgi:hypothetical protein
MAFASRWEPTLADRRESPRVSCLETGHSSGVEIPARFVRVGGARKKERVPNLGIGMAGGYTGFLITSRNLRGV